MARVELGDAYGPAGAGLNMDAIDLGDLYYAVVTEADTTRIVLRLNDSYNAIISGSGFDIDETATKVSGTVTGLRIDMPGTGLNVTGLKVPLLDALSWVIPGNNDAAFNLMLGGNDVFVGSQLADLIRGYGGADVITGARGADSIYGGSGDDTIFGHNGEADPTGDGANFLRGEAGNDLIRGGDAFDDMHGNTGNDTLAGGRGDDWVVGGQDNDRLSGDQGDDLIYGNMGQDTCLGGAGADTIRGGQDADTISGGDGNDWIAGDRGYDTISGGAGADIFYVGAGAGSDRILDFSYADGDRLMVDPDAVITLRQFASDLVLDFESGEHITLAGVKAADFTADWLIIGAA